MKRIHVANVRGIPAREDGTGQQFDLDAPLVLLSGPNGYGKTSLCDALSIGLNGPALPKLVSPFFFKQTMGEVEATTTGDCDRFKAEITKDGRAFLVRGQRESQNGTSEPWERRADEAALPALASAFFQDRLEIDLSVVVPHLKVDLPELSGLRAKLHDYRQELSKWLEDEWPQALVEPEDQLIEARRQVVAELIETWSAWSTGGPVQLDSLALKQNNPPQYWPGRLRKRVLEIAETWKMSVSLTKTSTISDSLDAFRKIVDDRIAEQLSTIAAPGTSVRASLHWPQRLLDQPTTLEVLRGVDGESEWTGSASEIFTHYQLPLDEPSFLAVEQWLNSLETLRLEAEQRGQAIRRALVWFAEESGSRLDIVTVLRAMAGDGVDWSQPPELPEIAPPLPPLADEWLQAHIVDHEKEHRAAVDAFEGWRSDLDNVAGEQESLALQLSERRIQGKLLLAVCRRLESEEAYQDVLYKLDDDQELQLSELEAWCAGPSHTEPQEPIEVAKLRRVQKALERWIQVETRFSEREAILARDYRRLAAEHALDPYIKALDRLLGSGKKSDLGLLYEAIGLQKDEIDSLLTAVRRVFDEFRIISGARAVLAPTHGMKKDGPSWSLELGFDIGDNKQIPFDDMSTGQRTQLSLAMIIALNLLLEGRLDHRVLVLDDVSTAVDLAQIPRVALLLRRLTYAAPEGSRRQIIVSTHHEDLTNRLLELLAPPPGEKLREIQFVGWTPQSGPETVAYEASGADQGDAQVEKRKRLFGTLLDSGVDWIARASGAGVPARSSAVEDHPDSP